jgi:hypothetical protein
VTKLEKLSLAPFSQIETTRPLPAHANARAGDAHARILPSLPGDRGAGTLGLR